MRGAVGFGNHESIVGPTHLVCTQGLGHFLVWETQLIDMQARRISDETIQPQDNELDCTSLIEFKVARR